MTDHKHTHTGQADLTLRRKRWLGISLVLNFTVVIFQVFFGVIAHSMGLLADAGHNLTDVGAIALSLVAVRLLGRAPTKKRTFGFTRASILAAQANAAIILLVTCFIAYEAIRRLFNPEPVDGAIVVLVAALGAIVNFGCAFGLRERDHGHAHGFGAVSGASRDINIRSATLHLLGDGFASIGVVFAGVIILITNGWYWIDPVVSILIGVLIAVQGYKLLREANNVLLESAPSGFDSDKLIEEVLLLDEIISIHDLHIWSLSSEMLALSAHVVIDGDPLLKDAQDVSSRLKALLEKNFGIGHATIELECASGTQHADVCQILD